MARPKISADQIRAMMKVGKKVNVDQKEVRDKALEALLEAIFQGIPVKVSDSEIVGDIDLTKCPHESLDSIGELPNKLKDKLIKKGITEAPIIKGPLEIISSSVNDRILAAGVVFLNLSFSKTTLGSRSDFVNATFANGVDFEGATFSSGIDFRGAIFGDNSMFMNATFHPSASFQSAEFGDDSSFLEATFNHGIKLEHSKFGNKIIFDRVQFKEEVSFENAKFGHDTQFKNATFHSRISFDHAQFSGDVTFMDSTFMDDINFGGAHFIGKASFLNNAIGKRFSFELATFDKKARAIFEDTTFGDGALFDRTSFKARVVFAHTKFMGSVTFQGKRKQEDNEEDKPVFQNEVVFNWVDFDLPERVRFQHVSLKKASFLNTRLDRVRFIDVIWDERDRKRALYDERKANTKEDYELVAQLYHQLKKNYEEERAYPEAGDFHYGEMEITLRIHQARGEWLSRLLTRTYKFLSGYGEEPLWALYILFWIWILPAVIAYMPAIMSTDAPINSLTNNSPPDFFSSLLDSLLVSIKAMSLRIPDLQPTIIGKTVMIIQALLGPIQIALVALALRRKFRR